MINIADVPQSILDSTKKFMSRSNYNSQKEYDDEFQKYLVGYTEYKYIREILAWPLQFPTDIDLMPENLALREKVLEHWPTKLTY